MPILLTTPKQTGDLDPNNSEYTHVKILEFIHDDAAKRLHLNCKFGVLDSNANWHNGILNMTTHVIHSSDYIAIVGQMPELGETIFQAARRALYEYLINSNIYLGSIV